MSNPEQPPVYFSDTETTTAFGPHMGDLTKKFQLACDDNARTLFGDTYVPHPSTVELTPYVNPTEGITPEIIVRAWHETGIPGKSAVFQAHDTVVTVILTGENAFLSNKDTKTHYPLTTRETLLLNSICGQAIRDYMQHLQDE